MSNPSDRTRRHFLIQTAAVSAGLSAAALTGAWRGPRERQRKLLFELSLGHWSYHRAIFGDSRRDGAWFDRMLQSDPDRVLQGPMDTRDLAKRARTEFNMGAVDYSNQLFFGHAKDTPYLRDMKQRADDHEVKGITLLCDRLGNIGDHDANLRRQSIEAHYPWIDAAAALECPILRVNAYGSGSPLEQLNACAESLNQLAEYGVPRGVEIVVENHGRLSSNGAWLAMLIEKTANPAVGAMADFDNFNMAGGGEAPRRYDRYQGMRDLAPVSKAISSKAHAFDEHGEETTIDFKEMMRIVLDTGYRSYVSVEYEGNGLTETEGIRMTQQLLERVRADLEGQYQ